MTRLITLFATAAVVLLLLGLVTSRLHLQSGLALSLPARSYFLSYWILCFGAALFFCLFAFAYSLWMVPWSAQAGMWHFGLSVFSVGLFVLSAIVMGKSGMADYLSTRSATQIGFTWSAMPIFVAFVMYCLMPVLFLLVQGFYILDGLRRCLSLLHRTSF